MRTIILKAVLSDERIQKHLDGEWYFVARKPLELTIGDDVCTLEYQEFLVDKIKVGNENSEKEIEQLFVLREYNKDSVPIPRSEVDELFTSLKKDILHTGSFVGQVEGLKLSAMKIDTMKQKKGKKRGRYGTTKWSIYLQKIE